MSALISPSLSDDLRISLLPYGIERIDTYRDAFNRHTVFTFLFRNRAAITIRIDDQAAYDCPSESMMKQIVMDKLVAAINAPSPSPLNVAAHMYGAMIHDPAGSMIQQIQQRLENHDTIIDALRDELADAFEDDHVVVKITQDGEQVIISGWPEGRTDDKPWATRTLTTHELYLYDDADEEYDDFIVAVRKEFINAIFNS